MRRTDADQGWNGESVKSVVKGGKSVTTNDVLGAERAVRPLSRTSVSDAKSYEPLKVTPLAEKSLRERGSSGRQVNISVANRLF